MGTEKRNRRKMGKIFTAKHRAELLMNVVSFFLGQQLLPLSGVN